MSATLKQTFERYTTPLNLSPQDGIDYWQERLLLLILLSSVIVGFFVLVPSIVFAWRAGFWYISIFDSVIWLMVLVLLSFKTISYQVRAFVIVALFYLLAVVLSFTVGPFGSSLVWLFMSPVIASLLFGKRVIALTLGVTTGILIVIGFFIHYDLARWPYTITTAFPVMDWIASALNFLLLNVISVFSTRFIFTGLQRSLIQEQLISKNHQLNLNKLSQMNRQLQDEISDRLEARQALRASEEKYRLLITQMNEGVAMLDQELNITYVNPSITRITGYSEDELIGRSSTDFLGGDSQVILQEINRRDISNNPESEEISIIKKDGEKIPMLASTVPLKRNQSRVGIIAILTDISKLKAAEKSLLDYQKNLEEKIEQRTGDLIRAKIEAEAASEAKSEFLANISHELRTPMHHILNYSRFGLTKTRHVPLDKVIQYFARIRKSGERLMILLNNLLDFSKLEAGKMTYEMGSADLIPLINDVVTDFETELENKHVSIEIQPAEFKTIVWCDRYKISQVLQNLISNAIKHSPDEHPINVSFNRTVTRNDQKLANAIHVMISDKGIGIPENELGLIFESFSQSSRTKDASGGTGLGLSICKKIIEDHSGEIWAESWPLQGTTIHFTLPEHTESDVDY